MKINTKATNISLTPAITEYIDKKLESLVKFFSNTDEVIINVEVGKSTKHHKSGEYFRAELHVISAGEDYYVAAQKDDLYAAIDEVKDGIIREMTSRRKRTIRLVRKGGARIKAILKNLNPWKS